MTLPTDHDMTHLRASERDLFRAFLASNPLPDASYDFDFRLGQGIPPDPAWPPWLADMALALTQRRADVLATTPSAYWILEIKDRAGPDAIGQLLLYRALFLNEYQPELPVRLGIIAPRLGFDLQPVLDEFDIASFLV